MKNKLRKLQAAMLATGIGVATNGMQVAAAQAAPVAPTAPIERRDLPLDEASAEIGRALFLRCLCAEDNLSFDVQGRLLGNNRIKITDWTLAGMNVQKAERKGPNAVELDGVRVAIRYAADRHEFERHPQKDETMRVVLVDNGDPVAFERTLAAVFAQGLDRPLQRAMPLFWQHYFEPGLAWPLASPDAMTGITITNVGTPAPAASGLAGAANGAVPTAPVATHRAEANYTAAASHDRIKGSVRLRLVVDTEGQPRRISVVQPLGYGLDEQAVVAAAKMRFTPGMLAGQPVATNVVLDREFVYAQPPPGR